MKTEHSVVKFASMPVGAGSAEIQSPSQAGFTGRDQENPNQSNTAQKRKAKGRKARNKAISFFMGGFLTALAGVGMMIQGDQEDCSLLFALGGGVLLITVLIAFVNWDW